MYLFGIVCIQRHSNLFFFFLGGGGGASISLCDLWYSLTCLATCKIFNHARITIPGIKHKFRVSSEAYGLIFQIFHLGFCFRLLTSQSLVTMTTQKQSYFWDLPYKKGSVTQNAFNIMYKAEWKWSKKSHFNGKYILCPCFHAFSSDINRTYIIA